MMVKRFHNNKLVFLVFSCFILGFLSISLVYADVPHKFNYQAMIRDDAGNPLASKDVEVSIAILKGGADGTEVFAETHQATTNEFGIVNLRIGSETIMEGINWGAGVYYIQVSVDGKIMGSSPLLSVPYAIHSASSADAFSGDYHDLAGAPDLAGFIYIDAPQDGDMIFFDEDEWQSLNQGDEGQVLTIVDGKPAWADLTPGGNGDDNTVTVKHAGDSRDWDDEALAGDGSGVLLFCDGQKFWKIATETGTVT